MNTVIKVENLSKQYRLGLVGSGTFKEDTKKWWAKIRGKENPFLKIEEENDKTQLSNNKYVWSLKDINFEVYAMTDSAARMDLMKKLRDA